MKGTLYETVVPLSGGGPRSCWSTAAEKAAPPVVFAHGSLHHLSTFSYSCFSGTNTKMCPDLAVSEHSFCWQVLYVIDFHPVLQ